MKRRFWLVDFNLQIDCVEIGSFFRVLDAGSSVTEAVAKVLADAVQKTLYLNWKELPRDEDESCANDGTHRQTPWLCGIGKKAEACIYWRRVTGLGHTTAQALINAGIACAKPTYHCPVTKK